MKSNPLNLQGIEFVEFASGKPEQLEHLFFEFGFSKTHSHQQKNIDLFVQNDIHFLLNRSPLTFAGEFAKVHGPSISAMGWRFHSAKDAYEMAILRGAKPALQGDYLDHYGKPLFAIYGIGDSLIYFVEDQGSYLYENMGFSLLSKPQIVAEKGFLSIDHLTNNVAKGTMETWANFYKQVFGFTEVRYFDIRGAKTGLTSYALKSPCGTFCIPINEAAEEKSQINEYLREYHGPGIQHLAFLTDDIVASLNSLKGSSITTLDIDPEYYNEVFDRVKQVTENHETIRNHKILVDGDEDGYLLQIFTKNIIGPIFIEIIQRKNHYSFGEGNFQALFRSIERDQAKRGVFEG